MTKVKFIIFKAELVAMFPDMEYSKHDSSLVMSYQRVGQHGAASRSLLRCKSATKDQYISLYKELVSIGYDDLKIMNKN